ncbi:ORF6N domain-containing protein [Providencia heimbachae]|uniref:ORF6N domain-containing protein n=1 Tax=Providencia heimbachae TaxID=333962 RepID=UPI0014197046|nr:ORF6N domain-containing protein [Providencia heimbachae]NIH23374.1 ORF6N domain-containing protein [Providencia heimbachae]
MSQITLTNYNSVVTQNSFQVPEVYYRQQKVITTESLAIGYGATSQQITNNFNRNKGRFEEGKHYFRVEGDDVEILRNSFRGAQISSRARTLYLWTERGAARHAKMLDTDKAWDIFELMEDHYFNQNKTEVMERPKPEKQYRYLIDIKIHDTELKDTHEFLGKATTPENIIHGLARRYGYAIERMLSLPPNCI